MEFIDVTYPAAQIEDLFPCMGNEGTDVRASEAAQTIAGALLRAQNADMQWHTPDTFAVRYGSNYIATATAGNLAVRFHSDLGTFREGDDK